MNNNIYLHRQSQFDSQLCVLKFGSSVLPDLNAFKAAASEVYRYVRQGERVLVVVSALDNATNHLVAQLETLNPGATAALAARLTRLGEYESSALFAAALAEVGMRVAVVDPHEIDLVAKGERLDAEPIGLNVNTVETKFEQHEVLIVPGFSAQHIDGGCTLLGRGGSDLSAVFIAMKMGVGKVRLLKNVDGVYTEDPADNPKAKRFGKVTYNQARRFCNGLVQTKAIDLADKAGLTIEVAALGAQQLSSIEPGTSKLASIQQRRPLTVALLGCGAVGAGVLEYLQQWPDRFLLNPILVRNLNRPERLNLSKVCYTDQLEVALANSPDLIIELLGGEQLPQQVMQSALEAGQHVVTANKAVVSTQCSKLLRAAKKSNCYFYFSASVGGGVPILETLTKALADGREIKKISGIMNGTCNYILGKLSEGVGFDAAVQLAQVNGFAEADPSADLDGGDAAAKLMVMANIIGYPLSRQRIKQQSLCNLSKSDMTCAQGTGHVYKQISELDLINHSAKVSFQKVPNNEMIASINNEHNYFCVHLDNDEKIELYGKGAGRWPTATSVLADVLTIWRNTAEQEVNLQKAEVI